jgi:hypothetical protein
MSIKKMNNVLSKEARLKIAIAINQGVFTFVHNVDTKEILSFVSIRKAAEFLGIHPSSIAKSIQIKGFFPFKKGNILSINLLLLQMKSLVLRVIKKL